MQLNLRQCISWAQFKVYMLILGLVKEKIDLFLRALFSVHSLKGWVTAASVSKKHSSSLLTVIQQQLSQQARQLSEKLDASGLLDLCKTSTRSRETVLCGIGT